MIVRNFRKDPYGPYTGLEPGCVETHYFGSKEIPLDDGTVLGALYEAEIVRNETGNSGFLRMWAPHDWDGLPQPVPNVSWPLKGLTFREATRRMMNWFYRREPDAGVQDRRSMRKELQEFLANNCKDKDD